MKRNVIIMNEYNFNIEEIEEANGANTSSPKKPKKRIALKIAASLMAMTIVSAGSIGVYRQFAETSKNSATSENNVNSENNISAETVSMLKTAQSDGDVLSGEEIVEKVMPSVVGIESTFSMPEQQKNGRNGFFGFGFDFGNEQVQQEPVGTGTGVIITEDGYIVTNAHVIYDSQNGYGLASAIKVLLGEDTYEAEVIGYDTDCDLAVLKVDEKNLTAAEFGSSDDLKLGETVIAIGNPLGFDLMNTVTRGCVSGLNRNITINDKSMNLIQTDAAINSGNSGGPLINKYGQVIGINSSKMSSSYYGEASIEGIGFAIPSDEVSKIVDDIMNFGYVTGKPQLGISCQAVTETISQMYNMPMGVYVVDVTENSAAAKAGLKKGDIITAVDGTEVTTSEELTAQKNLHSAGDEIELTFIRNGEEMTATVTLDEMNASNN